MRYVTIMITTGDRVTAQSISRKLIEEHLVACANIFAVDSIYRWKGEVEEAQEQMVLMKARKEDFPTIRDRIASMHPYEVPCIVCYDIAEGLPSYLSWVEGSTER